MDGDKHWYDEERYSSRDSDESPILYNRYDKYARRYATPKMEEKERRSTFSVLAKFFLFCLAMILFCVFMYIPVYNKANRQVTRVSVAGWSRHTNRDTKVYVQPNNVTTIHEPKDLCPKITKNKLFLLIVVCSSTNHFDRRIAIRKTWGHYKSYLEMSKLFDTVREKYVNYNYTYDLTDDYENVTKIRVRKDISKLSDILPKLAKALQDSLATPKTDNVPEKRFDDDNSMLPEFDMNQQIGEQTEPNYEDYYESNVMKIPPNGYVDTPDLEKVISMLKGNKNLPKIRESLKDGNTEVDFKVVFLLGLPAGSSNTTVQSRIEQEVLQYNDIIQEGFIDSYNNLTLKSIMMLKWINNSCNNSVRYILKTDDDMYINVPNLMNNLKNRSRIFDSTSKTEKEYLLIGDLICGAKPVKDSNNKWYSPRYMYGGKVYPKYLSGTGYVLSMPTASALYSAALTTNYFHLEDIYITGLCAARAQIRPRDDSQFSYGTSRSRGTSAACNLLVRATAHRVTPTQMHMLYTMLQEEKLLDTCERMRLTKVRRERMQPKPTRKSKRRPFFCL